MPKLTLEFSDRDSSYLNHKATEEQIPKADVLRIALKLYHIVYMTLHDPKAARRRALVITEDNRILKEVAFLPLV